MLSTAMHWRIEHIEAELLICRSPALICNYIFSAVFMYFWRGFLCKKRWVLGQSSTPRWGSLQRSPTLPSWVGRAPTCTLPGTARPLLHPTPCHTLTGAPPPPSQFLDPPLLPIIRLHSIALKYRSITVNSMQHKKKT